MEEVIEDELLLRNLNAFVNRNTGSLSAERPKPPQRVKEAWATDGMRIGMQAGATAKATQQIGAHLPYARLD